MTDDDTKLVPVADVILRRLEREHAEGDSTVGVFCPRQQRPIDVRSCRGCEHCHGLRIDPASQEMFLRCAWQDGEASAERTAVVDDPRSTQLRETKLSSIMSPAAVRVTADMRIAALPALFLKHRISAVPVVDARGRAIGVVSKADLLPYLVPRDEPNLTACFAPAVDGPPIEIGLGVDTDRLTDVTVGDVMSRLVHGMGKDSPISRAAALMAYEGVHRVIVLGPDGAPHGVVSSLDILSWLARCDGYVLPS